MQSLPRFYIEMHTLCSYVEVTFENGAVLCKAAIEMMSESHIIVKFNEKREKRPKLDQQRSNYSVLYFSDLQNSFAKRVF